MDVSATIACTHRAAPVAVGHDARWQVGCRHRAERGAHVAGNPRTRCSGTCGAAAALAPPGADCRGRLHRGPGLGGGRETVGLRTPDQLDAERTGNLRSVTVWHHLEPR